MDADDVDAASSAGTIGMAMARSKAMHGDKIVVAIGKFKGYLVVAVGRKGKPLECKMCHRKSNEESYFPGACNEDEFGGFIPWRYAVCASTMVRQATGHCCALCKTMWRFKAFRAWGGVGHRSRGGRRGWVQQCAPGGPVQQCAPGGPVQQCAPCAAVRAVRSSAHRARRAQG